MFDWAKTLGDSLGWLANIIQVAGVGWLFVSLWQARAAYINRRRIQELHPVEGAMAVAIGVGTPIEAHVRKFLERQFPGEDGGSRMPLVNNYYRSGFLPINEFEAVLREIRDQVIDELRRRGDVREIHLFYAGPYAIAIGIGALVDNWVPVQIYMHDKKTGDYALALSLHGEVVKGV